MRELADEGRTMLIVTHEMRFAREVSSKVVFYTKVALKRLAHQKKYLTTQNLHAYENLWHRTANFIVANFINPRNYHDKTICHFGNCRLCYFGGLYQRRNQYPNNSTRSAKPKSIVIATEAAYPPFNDTDASGQIIGFDVDVMNALCAEMHAHCQIIAQDWDGLIPSLLAGKYDAIIAGMSITPERQAQVDFSDSYFSNTIVWLCQK